MDDLRAIQGLYQHIVGEWERQGLALTPAERSGLLHGDGRFAEMDYFLQNKITAIMAAHQPPEATLPWLPEVDAFFSAPANNHLRAFGILRSGQYDRAFASICRMLLPIVSADQVFRLRAFDAHFIDRDKLYFFDASLPRNLDEAWRIYELILELPPDKLLRPNSALYRINQPFKAQWLLHTLFCRGADDDPALLEFQRDCLEKCPAYLLDMPAFDTRQGKSPKPAGALTGVIRRDDLRQILLRRGSAELQKGVRAWQEQERAERATALMLAPEPDAAPPAPVLAGQQELVDVLAAIDDVLASRYPDFYNCLQPGLTDAQVRKVNEQLAPLRLPDDLATLYQWHNSTVDPLRRSIFFDFYPIQDVLLTLQRACTQFEWCRAWLTVGDHAVGYFVVPLSEESKSSAPVFSYDVKFGALFSHHQSCLALAKTWLKGLRLGLFRFNGSFVEYDDELDRLRLLHSPAAVGTYLNMFEEEWPAHWEKYRVNRES